jgi:hypothetical protein
MMHPARLTWRQQRQQQDARMLHGLAFLKLRCSAAPEMRLVPRGPFATLIV